MLYHIFVKENIYVFNNCKITLCAAPVTLYLRVGLCAENLLELHISVMSLCVQGRFRFRVGVLNGCSLFPTYLEPVESLGWLIEKNVKLLIDKLTAHLSICLWLFIILRSHLICNGEK